MAGFFREQIVKRITRSSGWRKVRNICIERDGKKCLVCGSTHDLQVHHIEPFSDCPEKELDPDNLLTLCGNSCHIVFGHLKNFKSYNPDVLKDVAEWADKIARRPG